MNELREIENELVPVYMISTGEKVVYGTELYEILEVKSKFADWIKNRLNDCEVSENEDYEAFSKNLENGGRIIEYIIKLDTAKEMAMLERNEKGKQVRRYFIGIEKKYKGSTTTGIPTGKQLMALAVLEAQKTIAEQNQMIERMKPKEVFTDAVTASSSSILIGELAKILKQNGVDTGEKQLFTMWILTFNLISGRKHTTH